MTRRRSILSRAGLRDLPFRYWGLQGSSAPERVIYNELEFREKAAGQDLTSPSAAVSAASASSIYTGSRAPHKAFDDSTGSLDYWMAAGRSGEIYYDFAQPVSLVEVSIFLYSGNNYWPGTTSVIAGNSLSEMNVVPEFPVLQSPSDRGPHLLTRTS